MKFLRWVVQTYHHYVRYSDTKPIELVLSSVSVTWGLWVANPFADSLDAAAFEWITTYAPEVVIGLVFCINGTLRLYSIYRDSVSWRYRLATTSYYLWFLMMVSALVSGEMEAATPFFFSFTLMSVNIAARTARARERKGRMK